MRLMSSLRTPNPAIATMKTMTKLIDDGLELNWAAALVVLVVQVGVTWS